MHDEEMKYRFAEEVNVFSTNYVKGPVIPPFFPDINRNTYLYTKELFTINGIGDTIIFKFCRA